MHARARAAVDLRLTRAALFAAVCVALSAAGHTTASGTTVPLPALAAGWSAVFLPASLLAGRERSLPGIAGVLLGGQLTLHTLFGWSQGRPPCPGPGLWHTGPPGAPDHAIHHLSHGGVPGAVEAAHGFGCAVFPLSLPMLLGHLGAALVVGWFLRGGEAALWRLVRLAARAAETSVHAFPLRVALALAGALLGGLPGMATRRPAPRHGAEPPRGRPLFLRHSVVRRGPPEYALAA